MPAVTFIARREIHAVASDGSSRVIQLGIGTPYKISKDEWACPLCLHGLHEHLKDMHGVDSWQALQLAYQLIAQLLGSFVEDGGRLYWPGAGEETSVQELLPRVGHS